MKAYVTSIGEKTTDICVAQLRRYGFDVELLDKKEDWPHKYSKFLFTAQEDCLRVDADIIPNENIAQILTDDYGDDEPLMIQYQYYCLYRNNIHLGNPVFYTRKAIDIIRDKYLTLDMRRPEASAWRLPEINSRTLTSSLVVGMHGFFQDKETIDRAKKNKEDRGQMKLYDFDLAYKLTNL